MLTIFTPLLSLLCFHTQRSQKQTKTEAEPEKNPTVQPLKHHFRVSRKSKAPTPPGLRLDSQGFSPWHPGNLHLTMDQKENLQDKELSLTVVLPGGVEQMTVVHGSKPLMDLLVTLCAKYHLNPASHTLELVTASKNSIKLKPSALIGTLDAEKIILKTKGEDKNKKTGPQMPEATVRMVINYKRTQKTILRVNPRVPLSELLPAICEKCEFDTETTVLMKDGQSLTPLDLSSSLNDYAIREVYARDTKGKAASALCPSSPADAGAVTPGKAKNQKEEENKGLFSMFRKSKKKSEQPTTASAPGSPVLVSKPRPLSMALPCSNSSNFVEGPKKRRAPQPPNRVFQRSHSDIGTSRRFSSEPGAQLDQMAGASRGSSAQSSLKRTKRKAPPPPTSPSAVVHNPVSQEEPSQAITAPKTLEEIMEKEEVTSTSAAHNGILEENRSLSVSPEVQYLSPDIAMESTKSVEGGEEDRSDQPSDGIQIQVKDSAVASEAGKSNETDVATNNGCQIQIEDPNKPSISEGSPSDATDNQINSLPPAVTQDAETSVQTNTDAPQEQYEQLDSLEPQSISRRTGEDAQVQTDFEDFPAPPLQSADNRPASVNSSSSHTSETPLCRDSPPSASTATKGTSMFATDVKPKPKPSNELTRDYTPKVGMKTYTIVPQKSLEKLRYFEVALILEAPPKAPAEGQNTALPLDESVKQTGRTEVSENTNETHPDIPSIDSLNNTSVQHTLNGVMSQLHSSSPARLHSTDESSSPANGESQAVSSSEVKEMKIPPVTKPKPTSFRLPQLKKTPGYYVTSAAEKTPNAGSGFGLNETSGSSERAALPPPPLPPPVQCQQETPEATGIQLSPKQVDGKVALSRQTSLPLRESSAGLSVEKLRSFAAPKPYSPLTPSRFAQAVSSAVRRSQSLSHGPKSPPFFTSTPTSPTPSLSSITETRGLFCLKQDCEGRELERDNSSLQREEGLQMAGECSP
uniref:Cordon-bleu ubiquitin-like domain-containing protein n=1 Tax=Oryzias latipes TaxID=8090 RepID=A0A3P9IA06_ORYLA